jgi:hypothetical protein
MLTEGMTDIELDWHRERHKERQMDGWMDGQMHRRTDEPMDRRTLRVVSHSDINKEGKREKKETNKDIIKRFARKNNNIIRNSSIILNNES